MFDNHDFYDENEENNSHISVEIVYFILNEFEDEYKFKDKDNPCFLYYGLMNGYLNFVECLAMKYEDKYSLKPICDTLNKVMNNVDEMNMKQRNKFEEKRDWWNECGRNIWWNKASKEIVETFLGSLKEFCLKNKCKNQDDINMITDTVNKISKFHSENEKACKL